jgi:hypothetical protein
MKTPGSTVEENGYSFNFSVSREGRRANTLAEFSATGAPSELMKSEYFMMDEHQCRTSFQSLILNFFKTATFDSVKMSDMRNPEEPFRANVYYHLDSTWTDKSSRYSYGSYANLALDLFVNRESYPHPDARHFPIITLFPFSINGREYYARPTYEFSETIVPEKESLDNKYISCDREFERNTMGAVVRWSIIHKQSNIPLQDYKTFYADINRLKEILQWSVSFVNLRGKFGY